MNPIAGRSPGGLLPREIAPESRWHLERFVESGGDSLGYRRPEEAGLITDRKQAHDHQIPCPFPATTRPQRPHRINRRAFTGASWARLGREIELTRLENHVRRRSSFTSAARSPRTPRCCTRAAARSGPRACGPPAQRLRRGDAAFRRNQPDRRALDLIFTAVLSTKQTARSRSSRGCCFGMQIILPRTEVSAGPGAIQPLFADSWALLGHGSMPLCEFLLAREPGAANRSDGECRRGQWGYRDSARPAWH
jgi:hypothetical protein